MPNALEQLKKITVIVADTGDAELVARHKPQDCTTNPSLVLGALDSPDAKELIEQEVSSARARSLALQCFVTLSPLRSERNLPNSFLPSLNRG